MIIVFHVTVALASVVYTTYLYFNPSKTGLRIAYALVAAMLASGTYLTIKNPAHLTQTCLEGLVYLGIVAYGLVSARHKLAISQSTI